MIGVSIQTRPRAARQIPGTEESYEAKVDRTTTPGGCHLWTAAISPLGYGKFFDGQTTVQAHRWAWTHYIGPIPEGLEVCHQCDTPGCQRIHPDHCVLGTHKRNMEEMASRGRSHKGSYPCGDAHGMSKLTWAQVDLIRARYAGGGVTHRQLAKAFDVGKSTITRIISNAIWKEELRMLPLDRSLRLSEGS